MKRPFIGASLKNIQPSCFARHGIPVPLYALDGSLLLLFKNEQECRNYITLLEGIKGDMAAADPFRTKDHIQAALSFIDRITAVLNCD